MSNPDSVILEEEMDENYEPSQDGTRRRTPLVLSSRVARDRRRTTSPRVVLEPSRAVPSRRFVIPPGFAFRD